MISYRKYKLKRTAQTFILDLQRKVQFFHPAGKTMFQDIYEARDAEIAEHALSAIDIIDTRGSSGEFLMRLLGVITEIRKEVRRPDTVDLDAAKRLLEEDDLRFRFKWYYQISLPEALFRKFDGSIPPAYSD